MNSHLFEEEEEVSDLSVALSQEEKEEAQVTPLPPLLDMEWAMPGSTIPSILWC